MRTPFSGRAHGFSMIEILVAVVVLAIGLLGVAALYARSLQSGLDGDQRSQATALAEDYASRIRVNQSTLRPSAVNLKDYLTTYAGTGANSWVRTATTCKIGSRPSPDCQSYQGATGAQCTAAQMAIYDQWDVCSQVLALLPDGVLTSTLRPNAATASRVSVAVGWRRTASETTSGEQDAAQRDTQCDRVGLDSNIYNCVILEVIP